MISSHSGHRVISILLALAIPLLAGCAPGFYQGTPEIPYTPEPITLTSEGGVTVSVTPYYWPYTPGNLPDYATPYYIEIQNQSGKTIDLYYGDVVLFDQSRAQYNPLSPEVVATAISTSQPQYGYSAPSYPRVSLGFGFGFGSGYHGYGRRGGYGPAIGIGGYYPGYYAPPPAAYNQKPVSTKDVLTFALGSGPIYPGSTVTGFVYFRHLPAQATEVTLDVGWRDPEKPDDMQVLSFPLSSGVSDDR